MIIGTYEPCYIKTCFLHICENKGADQPCSNLAADQHLFLHSIDSTITIHVLPKSKISSSSHLLWLHSPVCVEHSW